MGWLIGMLGSGAQDNKGANNHGQAMLASSAISAVSGDRATDSKGTNQGAGTSNISNNDFNKQGLSLGQDGGFYGHMTVSSARKNNIITGAGDVFNKTTEDKAFKRSSNLSGEKGDCRKAK